MNKKLASLLFVIIILIIIVVAVGIKNKSPKDKTSSRVDEQLPSIISQEMFYSGENFYWAVNQAEPVKERDDIEMVIVPHHLIASHHISRLIKMSAGRDIRQVIIIGPNHDNVGTSPLATAKAKWQTPLGEVMANSELTEKLAADLKISLDYNVFVNEHSIGAVVPFIKYYLPEAEILPIAVSSYASAKEINLLKDWLLANVTKNTLVVVSIDFSHYLSKGEAEKRDKITKDLILSNNLDKILTLGQIEYVDSPVSLAVALSYAQVRGLEINFLDHTNSFDLSTEKIAETTSHFAIYFVK